MSLPTSYLTSTKNLKAVLEAIQSAQAPEKFTQRFLESLEFKSNTDRLIIGVLKSLNFLDEQGRPTNRYFQYLDQTQGRRVLAEAISDTYDDLFRVNINAHKLSKQDVVNKFKTLSQGSISESVLDKMASTFVHLCGLADFSAPAASESNDDATQESAAPIDVEKPDEAPTDTTRFRLGGLHYNIQIILPESRDPKVYDALFKSLKEHLFK